MYKIVDIDGLHWIGVYAKLSNKNKRSLSRYFATIYPRSYVRRLVAAMEEDHNVQFKKAIWTN